VQRNTILFEVSQVRWGRFKFFSKQIIRRVAPHVIRGNFLGHKPTRFIP
jgi:hypothetical protein